MKFTNYKYDRPVIIVAAPRSGSTLLYDLMCMSSNAWSLGSETHAIFERSDKYKPALNKNRSNRLIASDADEENVSRIREAFFTRLKNRNNEVFDGSYKPRFIEKTPKNALRIPLLNEIFPDAYYVYLYRNPRENISSIIEAWKSNHFVTYKKLPGWEGVWSLLLPQGWKKLQGKPLEEIAAFQWQVTNDTIINDFLDVIPKERWTTISYSELTENTANTIERVCQFCDLEFDSVLESTCKKNLKISKYSLTKPKKNKWHKYASVLKNVMPNLRGTIDSIRKIAVHINENDFEMNVDIDDVDLNKPEMPVLGVKVKIGRNDPCQCGSGKKFKLCHGKVK